MAAGRYILPVSGPSDLEKLLLLQMKAAKLPTPVTEYRFHPTRKWRVDFYLPDHKLAIEVEGATFAQGRHTRGVGFEKDCEKYAELMLAGIRLLRVTGKMIQDGRALAYIERALDNGDARPLPLMPFVQ